MNPDPFTVIVWLAALNFAAVAVAVLADVRRANRRGLP